MDMTHRFPPELVGQNYAEASYFDGYAFQHIADWQEHLRLKRIRARCVADQRAIERRRGGRGIHR